MPAPAAKSRTPRIASQSPEPVRRKGLIDLPGGPDMAPRPPTLGRAPAQPWRASGLAQDVSSLGLLLPAVLEVQLETVDVGRLLAALLLLPIDPPLDDRFPGRIDHGRLFGD